MHVTNFLKVKYPEVIDVDVEEEDFDGIILANEPVGPNAKGKVLYIAFP